MCGFCGVVSPTELSRLELQWLRQGTDLLRHRGPDDEGFVLLTADSRARSLRGDDSMAALCDLPHIEAVTPKNGEVIGLGARRLSIMDLSPAGHMPMADDDGNWLVFNGEIYNHAQLRAELLAHGHLFYSHSDTEVLLRAYAQWGTACLERCNGMWAFALWDRARRRLFCARDRFGEKQLYYASTLPGGFRFASEIAPLRLATKARGSVHSALVWDFLLYGLADHTQETFFSGIEQLLPGTCLFLHPGGSPHVFRYYDLRAQRRERPQSLFHATAGLRERLHDSVRLRLRSDVPVASFFSGGLDSSSIVALADRILPALNGSSPYKTLRTYTHTYPAGDPYDESPRVRGALDRLPTVDAQFIEASRRENFQRDLLTMVARQEQPFHNVSIFAAYNLLRLIHQRDGIKVVLTGEAGDELLAGYTRAYLPLHLSRLLWSFHWVAWWREARAWNWRTGLRASVRGLFRKLPGGLRANLQRVRHPVAGIMRPEFLREYREREQRISDGWRGLDLNGRLVADITQFNLPQLLRHLDRNAMHWSVEARVPFLDHRLVEFACSLPEEWKLHRGYGKYVLREAMSSDLPAAIVWNPQKLGFGMAEQFWLKECLHLMQPSSQLSEFIDVAALQQRVCHREAQPEQAYWLPISLGLWLQTAFPGTM